MADAVANGLWRDGWAGVLRQFLRREASPPIQFVKYVIAGGTAVGVHTLIFFLAGWFLLPALDQTDIVVRALGLTVADLDPAVRARNAMVNTVPAFLVSNMVAYLINIAWVFHPGRYRWYLALGMFYVTSAVAVTLGTAFMGLLIRYLHWSTTVAFSANLVTSLLINFTVRKFVIFKG
jgi:putative flippase GtrA